MILCLIAMMALAPVTLQVSSADGKPIANREVWIMPTNSTKKIRNFGWQWWIPTGSDVKKGKTNVLRSVKIMGVKKGVPMMVITKFGPRFDPFVRARAKNEGSEVAKYLESHSMDVIKFEGAIYAGKPAKIVMADNYQITGRVTDFETGAPVPNMTVVLRDTGFGHIGGYPGTDLEETKTDIQGRYTFRDLPNLAYTVVVRKEEPSVGIESRSESGKWQVTTIFDENGKWQFGADRCLVLDRRQKNFDFRVSRTATLKVVVKKGTATSFKGWHLSVVGDSDSGSEMDLGWIDPNRAHLEDEKTREYKFVVIPGTYTISMTKDGSQKLIKISRLKLRSGANEKSEIKISDFKRS